METRKPHILLIDDDKSIRKLYCELLSTAGFVVTDAASAQDGLEHLLHGEEFDLIITDIMMAKMDGWELLTVIRKNLKLDALKLPVIVMSAFESNTLEMKALQYGANGCYVKGTPLQKLIREVKIQTGLMRSDFSAT